VGAVQAVDDPLQGLDRGHRARLRAAARTADRPGPAARWGEICACQNLERLPKSGKYLVRNCSECRALGLPEAHGARQLKLEDQVQRRSLTAEGAEVAEKEMRL
jgi:hypothetical protein